MIFSLPPCGVCRSPVPSVYSINYKRKKKWSPVPLVYSINYKRKKKSAHRNVASNNLRRLQRINSQEVRVSLRVEGDRAPERLQIAADQAARSGDLRTTIEYASGARHTIRLWNEFRVPRLGSR